MPLIMEEGLDVDDLFGDPNSLDLGLATAQPTKGLAQHLDEMRLLGCCRKIAWSRLGCIAYISQDGLQVIVRHLACNPTDGKWGLSDEYPQNQIAQLHLGQQLLHLCWNETGSDLAVLDASGRISILSIPTALNNLAISRQTVVDPPDDGAQVVGMMWMNSNRAVHAFHQAAKVDVRWGYSAFRRKPIGPFHPAGKPALICFTRNGIMRLLYQNPDQRWAEVSAELKTTNQSDSILTHAACLPSPNGILVATHSFSGKLSLFRVQIMWNPPQWDPAQQRQAGVVHFPVPSIRISHCKTEVPGRVFSFSKDQADDLPNIVPGQSFSYQLTNLELVSGQSDNTGATTSAPWILAVYSSPINSAGHDTQQPASVMVRWQLETSTLNLHPVFEELVSKRANGQQRTKLEIRRLEDIHFDKHVVSIDHVEFGNVLAITHDDSSISIFDPRSMSQFTEGGDLNAVTSMAQAGFRFPVEAPGLNICFSPNGCLAVVLDTDWQAQLRIANYNFEPEGDLHDGKNSIGIIALSLAFCRGCAIEYNTDDLLVTISSQLSSEAQNVFVNEVYRALPINCNFSVEQEKPMQNPYVPRCLSLQAALGFQSSYTPRGLPSSVPWAILHLRHASLLFAFFFSYSKAPKENETLDHDVLQMVYGNTKWALDFTQYLLDDLFALAKEFEPVLDDKEALAQKVKTTSSLSLNLVLASMSRAFLHLVCRGLRGVHTSSIASPFAGDGRAYSKELYTLIDKAPVRFNVYEKFLNGVESAIKNAYQAQGLGDNDRRTPEKDLLLNSRIPAIMIPVIVSLFRQTIPAVQAEIDQMSIYLTDYSWLGVCDDRRTEHYRRTRHVDIVKKVPLRGFNSNNNTIEPDITSPSRRRCVRCCEVTGDPSSPRSLLYFNLTLRLQLIRNCLCGGMWTFEAGPPTTTTASTALPTHGPRVG
ncbi:RNA polymerase II Mediator complex subunit Sin4, putative [Talaromyces stipitatus ATCC 10500]|uniref:Mediator of RNA polymerase II transcription subunit 16 n=1 Tax=Talaromyces stipitatus (strain ATCC 10500 / CBS 375.48 / QM 6759 / NRRL 1006) TaxID=441959 RepID=B8LW67_TALSN|nr:RNA polymerase II Mediator complex subunit Sin4, putative [Talaromyces stipitatus ATCC 10500]EED24095.1 RNA polymerase II Mediator complex subunit Sin4, putative [Talaromyces stipitatus ATCC 10500]